MIKSGKMANKIYFVCFAQFIVFAIVVNVFPYLDKKTILGLSAVLGIIISGITRRSYTAHKVQESAKELDKSVLDQIDEPNPS